MQLKLNKGDVYIIIKTVLTYMCDSSVPIVDLGKKLSLLVLRIHKLKKKKFCIACKIQDNMVCNAGIWQFYFRRRVDILPVFCKSLRFKKKK